MKTPRNYVMTTAMTLGVVATIVSGCGSDKKKSAAAPAPEVVNTTLVGMDAVPGSTKVRYGSNVKDAHFKCQTEVAGKASDWADCPADGAAIATQAGVKYTFRVKAISPAGTEGTPVETNITGADGAAAGGSTADTTVGTQIQNKGDIVAGTYAKSSLTLRLGVKGNGVNVENVRFECKRETDSDYKKCDDNDQAQYIFSSLQDGKSYSLSVRARVAATNAVLPEDSLSFAVALAKLPITNDKALDEAGTSDVSLTLDRSKMPNAKLTCAIDNAQSADCPLGSDGSILVQRQSLSVGSHKISIVANDTTGLTLGSSNYTFCVGSCGAPGTPMPRTFAVGGYYDFVIPTDMHITEYSATKGYNLAVDSFQVLGNSDPFYLGITHCAGNEDIRRTASSPNGSYYDYCESTPPRADIAKWLTDNRSALNHIEVASNKEVVIQAPQAQERILINSFDAQYPFEMARSRFDELCLTRTGPIAKTPPIAFAQGFWSNTLVPAQFMMCATFLNTPGADGFPVSQQWWVGVFYIANTQSDSPAYECFTRQNTLGTGGNILNAYNVDSCRTFSKPNLLEVVYMVPAAGGGQPDQFFARRAQDQFVQHLVKKH